MVDKDRRLTFHAFHEAVRTCAAAVSAAGIQRRDRVAIWLDKSVEEAASIFGAAMADGVFVPCNALLRPAQIRHIMSDCEAKVLITTADRAEQLRATDGPLPTILIASELYAKPAPFTPPNQCIGEDLAAILYTSGSTGRPKGVMLVAPQPAGRLADRLDVSRHPARGSHSVAPAVQLRLRPEPAADRRSSSARRSVLLTFRFGDEIVRAFANAKSPALAGVPTIWAILTQAAPLSARRRRCRRSATSRTPAARSRPRRSRGCARLLPRHQHLPDVRPDRGVPLDLPAARRSSTAGRPRSARPSPRSEIFARRRRTDQRAQAGRARHPGASRADRLARLLEPARGHRARAAPQPVRPREHEGADIVCWSGDLVVEDEEGFFYFVGRDDAMIKSSGYRISPTEVEEVLMATGRLARSR